MGLDLALLPFSYDLCSFTVLQCERRRELWRVVTGLPAWPVDPGFSSYCGQIPGGGYAYGETQETPYGRRLTYTTVKHLLTLRDHEGVMDNPNNRAVWAYLNELPPSTKVALYWH